MPTAFASADELDAAALSAAPVHWPRPSRLDEPVTWKPRPAAEAAEALGPDHGRGPARPHPARLRRGAHDRRARARRDGDGHRRGPLDQLAPGAPARHEAAGRGRGQRRHRRHEGHLLQPAVAQGPVQGRDAAHAGRQVPGRQPLPRQQPRAHRRGGRRRGGRLAVPRDQGHHLDADPRRRARAPRRRRRRGRAAARRAARRRAPARPPGGDGRRALRRPRGRPRAAGLRRAARRPGRAAAPARRAPRHAGGRWRWPRSRRSRASGATRCCPSRPPATRPRRWTRSTPTSRPSARCSACSWARSARARPSSPCTPCCARSSTACRRPSWRPPRRWPSSTSPRCRRSCPARWCPVALLTGSTPAGRRADLLGKLRTGELKLIVGTHALIEEAVEFERLAVAVVDEQHRFGVRQRAALDAKAPEGLAPHVLHMTATPIPRTLRLAAFGALDVTTLRELPKGRQPIVTHVVGGERERERAYERIREELRAGRQAFVVCPLVSESEALQARAATAEFERLKETEFADFRVVLLHGQMRPREKAAAMEAFAARRRRRPGGHDRDRGRHRRPQRDRHARRGRRALRHLAAAPAARARRARRGPLAVPALRARRLAAPAGAGPPQRRLRAGRDRPRAARRGRADRHAPVRASRAFASRACPRTRRSSSAPTRARRCCCARTPACGRPSSRCWPPSSRRPRRSPWRREGRGRAPRRPAAAGAAGPPTRGRPPIACARRCSRCSGRSTARACSTCTPARARWPSRRSRGGRRRATAGRARRARDRGHPRQSGGARARRRRGPAWSTRRPARPSATHRRAATHTIWSSSTRRTGTRRRWDGSSRRPCPPCWRPPHGS